MNVIPTELDETYKCQAALPDASYKVLYCKVYKNKLPAFVKYASLWTEEKAQVQSIGISESKSFTINF